MIQKNSLDDLKSNISRESKTVMEIDSLYNEIEKSSDEEKEMFNSQIQTLAQSLKRTNEQIKKILEMIQMPKKLSALNSQPPKIKIPSMPAPQLRPFAPKIAQPTPRIIEKPKKVILTDIEKAIIKRIRKKEEQVKEVTEKKPSTYVRFANKMFSNTSNSLISKGYFKNIKRNLVKANIPQLAKSYVSVIFLSTIVSFFVALFIMVFFLFFNLGVRVPFITPATGDIFTRFLSVFWIIFVIPIGTYLFMLIYPSIERKALETKINQELPFATIHMAAISESMIEPSNIFSIIISTKEYPALEKEFIKLLNDVNVFGHDLVAALRNLAFNSPSKKLSELLDGLATTITTGGDLSEFFDKRAQTLLFDYRLEREKETKSAETFMDIYISVVIAAPMILMLLLIMMRISGLGIALSTTMISLIMVLGVSIINIVFLAFLQLKQQNQ